MSRIDSVQRAASRRATMMASKRPEVAARARATLRQASKAAPNLAMGWDSARERVTPLVVDARDRVADVYDRMSAEYMPRATQVVEHAALQAAEASEPYRREAAARGIAALAGIRGQVTPEDVRRIVRARNFRRRRIAILLIASGIAVGAAVGGTLLNRRRNDPAWIADHEEQVGDDAGGASVRSLSERASQRAHEAADRVKEAAARASDKVKSTDTADHDGRSSGYADGRDMQGKTQTWP